MSVQPDAAQREAIGGAVHIDTDLGHHLRMVPILQHCLVQVREGVKEIHHRDGVQAVKAGETVALPAGINPTLDNTPDPRTGRYRATAVAIDADVVVAFARQGGVARTGRPDMGMAAAPWPVVGEATAVAAAVRHAVDALTSPRISDAIARHRMLEVLLALAEEGVIWTTDTLDAVAHRVRLMVAGQPDAPWTVGRVAQRLNMSEATLRRRLAAEGTCFRDVLADARLSFGLILLQTSRAGIADVAAACGYDSPSRFAARFRERFGTPPSGIRTASPETLSGSG